MRPAMRALWLTLIVALAVMAGATTAAATPPSTANLYVVPSGGTASPTRMTTPTDFASAPSSAKCTTVQVCFTACQAGDTIVIRDGSYSSQTINTGSKTTSNPCKFYGNRTGVTLSGLNIGTGSASTPAGLSISGFTGRPNVLGSNFVTLDDFTANGYSFFAGTQSLTVSNCTFDGQHTTADVINVYEVTAAAAATRNWTMDKCLVTGGGDPGDSTTHPDGLQLCNCDFSAGQGDNKYADNVVIKNSTFKDNWCTNFRANENSNFVFENNLIYDSEPDPFSTCGYTISTERAATFTFRNNTIFGTIQQTWPLGTSSGTSITAYNNYFADVEQGCTTRQWGSGVKSHNWFGTVNCGGTNLTGNATIAGLNTTTGVPNTGSLLINAGDVASYPATDITGAARFAGSAPDIGAFEVGATGGSTPVAGTEGPITAGESASVSIFSMAPLAITSIARISAG